MSAADAPTVIQPPAGPVQLSAHPRAQRSVRRVRAQAGVITLFIVIGLSFRAGLPAWDAVARGLVCGIAVHFIAWAIALAVWRQIILGELERVRAEVEARRAERIAEQQKALERQRIARGAA